MGDGVKEGSRVKDEWGMGCKVVLYGNKVLEVWNFVCRI